MITLSFGVIKKKLLAKLSDKKYPWATAYYFK